MLLFAISNSVLLRLLGCDFSDGGEEEDRPGLGRVLEAGGP